MNRKRGARALIASGVVFLGACGGSSKPSAQSEPPKSSSSLASILTSTTTISTTAPATTATTVQPTTDPPATTFVYPDASLVAAQSAQDAVDQGHQPWRVDPSMVASSYGASIGWTQTTVTPVDSTTYDLVNAETRDGFRLSMTQPIRPGATGIWEITEARPI